MPKLASVFAAALAMPLPDGAIVTFKNEGRDAHGPYGPVTLYRSEAAMSALRPFGEPDPDLLHDFGWLPLTEAKKFAKARTLKLLQF